MCIRDRCVGSEITADELVSHLEKGVTVLGGMFDEELVEKIGSKGVKLYDYYKSESLLALNSVSTSEGILYELIGNSDINIHGSKTVVTGYGKAASAIAERLLALGAQVTVAARSESDRTRAETDGCKAVELCSVDSVAEGTDFVINTVPARVLGDSFISKLKKGCLMLEIASAPYGIDFESARKHGVRVMKLPSLPGRISPKSAGEAIAETLLCTVKGEVSTK